MHLSVWHQLRYRYDQPVVLNPHMVYLYPRTYPYQRLQQYDLQIDPMPSKVVRNVDVEGNVQQIIYFAGPTDHLTITAELTVDSDPFNSLDFVLFPFDTQRVPFNYAADLRPLLTPYLVRDGVTNAVEAWARQIATDVSWQTVPFLLALSDTIRQFVYVVREEGAPLLPEQTLLDRCGSCRDYTTLYMAACRSLGLAARFVSGYLFGSAQQEHQLHAWAEVYLPGAGWRGFDPTENTVVVNKHVFLASSARAELTAPVSGTFTGQANSMLEADVRIKGNEEC
ncbi:transglutaminase family protein [Fibrella sp. HMF5335]|uniref:Transglutaminase family protein n=1 Tax=Fibrella rubiginis TaxID=2817060 RepID=A0A939GGY0_9BACT|nr:transglutaminase family protein [Fibrella rubiginis]MBO0937588.1 transglutaminase family protein [Fibrella rubiginis]